LSAVSDDVLVLVLPVALAPAIQFWDFENSASLSKGEEMENEFTTEQLDYLDALATFEAAGGVRIAPYFTSQVKDGNVQKLLEFGAENISGGLNAASNVGFWEISFRAIQSSLTADPAYVRPLNAIEKRVLFQRLYDSCSTDQVKAIFNDAISSHHRPLNQTQESQLDAIGGVTAFQMFFNEGR
jgi:hypothetical protein